MLPENEEHYIINSTTEIGNKPEATFPPDPEHIKQVISEIKPDKILACGKVAQKGMELVGIDYIPAPHPAWRQLTRVHTATIKALLEEDVDE